MAKKQSSRNDSLPQGPVISVKNPFTPEKLAALERVLAGPAPSNVFEKFITDSGIEILASQTLDNADLPADRELVEARGFREGESKEWHAAELLRLVTLARGFVRLGEADYTAIYAFELGALLAEGNIKFNIRSEDSRPGGIARGLQQTEAQEKEWAKYQAAADTVWKKHLKWGKLAVAKEVHKKFPDVPAETIRPRIKKPSP